MFYLAIAAVSATIGIGAAGGGQAVEPAVQPAPVEKPICRRESVLGSNLIKRICRTGREWASIDRRNQETLERSGALDRVRNGPRRPSE